ncbi:MAG: ATP-dependent 6-phosphofructokinase [Candidatus Aureabacteria bacterium]|nr:ATP-dependent 6-phosphofructokinase [Candidatus Auribacterota bacterium]
MRGQGSGKVERIGVLTGGGDCPGLNAAIRAVTKTAINVYRMSVVGFKDGYEGLVERRFKELSYDDVSGIITWGGTILGTSNKADPFRFCVRERQGMVCRDLSRQAIDNARRLGVQALICIGGDGTLSIAHRLWKKGLPCVGVAKTIDNDLGETEVTFGFDSALTTAAEAIDKIRTTAESHHRVMVVEVMGRYVGWIALCTGLAGGGDVILIPEIPYRVDVICGLVKARHRKGRRFSIIVVSEGARPVGGKPVVDRVVGDSPDPVRLGGVGRVLAGEIEKRTGIEARVTVLGHLQRGGEPTAFDRILATRFGEEAVHLAAERRFGRMVGIKGGAIRSVTLLKAIARLKRVPRNSPLIRVARAVGTSFGI